MPLPSDCHTPKRAKIPAAAVELHPGSNADENELLSWCRQNLAAYKAPRRIWILEAGRLPQNLNGKILRRTVREQLSKQIEFLPGPAQNSVPAAPLNLPQSSLLSTGCGNRNHLADGLNHQFRLVQMNPMRACGCDHLRHRVPNLLEAIF